MLNDTGILLDLPATNGHRRLRSGQLRAAAEKGFVVEFPGEMEVILGFETVVYYHESTRFLQQVVRVLSVESDGTRTMLSLQAVGKPASAQSRDCYRAPVYAKVLLCRLGEEDNCRIVDVSLDGLGLVANEEHPVHSTLSCVLTIEDEEFAGTVAVVFADNRGESTTHYGLRSLDEDGAPFRKALCRLSLELQREQLARLGGMS